MSVSENEYLGWRSNGQVTIDCFHMESFPLLKIIDHAQNRGYEELNIRGRGSKRDVVYLS